MQDQEFIEMIKRFSNVTDKNEESSKKIQELISTLEKTIV